MDVGGVDIEGASVDSLDLSAHLLQNFADEGNVADVGYIFNLARLVASFPRNHITCLQDIPSGQENL